MGSITSTLQKKKLRPREGLSLDEVTQHVNGRVMTPALPAARAWVLSSAGGCKATDDTEIGYVLGACLCDPGFPRHACLHTPLTLLRPADPSSSLTPAVSLPGPQAGQGPCPRTLGGLCLSDHRSHGLGCIRHLSVSPLHGSKGTGTDPPLLAQMCSIH